MKILDLTDYRQWLVDKEQIALAMTDEEIEFRLFDFAEADYWLEVARQAVYPPLYCVK